MNIEALLNNTNWSPRQADSQLLALHFLFVIPCRNMVLAARLRHIPPLSFRRDNWLYPYAASVMLHFKSASQQFSPMTVQDKKIENCQTLSQ